MDDLNGVDIPPDVPIDPIKDLALWYTMQDQLRKLKFQEHTLRVRLVKHFFGEDAPEGTNTHPLPDGYNLKGIIVIGRDIDEGVYNINLQRYKELKIPVGKLVKFKPDLVKSQYNQLVPEQKKAFDECLVIKEGSPQLKISPPSNKGQ